MVSRDLRRDGLVLNNTGEDLVLWFCVVGEGDGGGGLRRRSLRRLWEVELVAGVARLLGGVGIKGTGSVLLGVEAAQVGPGAVGARAGGEGGRPALAHARLVVVHFDAAVHRQAAGAVPCICEMTIVRYRNDYRPLHCNVDSDTGCKTPDIAQ